MDLRKIKLKEIQKMEFLWKQVRKEPQKCIFPDCTKKAIRSHYHQVKGVLDELSENKIVWGIQWMPKAKGGVENTYQYEFVKRNINSKGEITTFGGFCNFHDTKVFEEIEKTKVSSIDYSCRKIQLLHAYRGVCNELYKQENNVIACKRVGEHPEIKILKVRFQQQCILHDLKVRITRNVKSQIESDIYSNTNNFKFVHFQLPRIEICTTAILGEIPEIDELNDEKKKIYWGEQIKKNQEIEGRGATNFVILIPQDDTLNVIIGTNTKKLSGYIDIEKISNYSVENKIKTLSDIVVREIETFVISDKLYDSWNKTRWNESVIDEINFHKPPETQLKPTRINIFQGLY